MTESLGGLPLKLQVGPIDPLKWKLDQFSTFEFKFEFAVLRGLQDSFEVRVLIQGFPKYDFYPFTLKPFKILPPFEFPLDSRRTNLQSVITREQVLGIHRLTDLLGYQLAIFVANSFGLIYIYAKKLVATAALQLYLDDLQAVGRRQSLGDLFNFPNFILTHRILYALPNNTATIKKWAFAH